MAVGDYIQLNGYGFYETLYGPLMAYLCRDCGSTTYGAESRRRKLVRDPEQVRCSACWRRHHGLD